MGELHLEIVVDRIKREFNINLSTGAPRVSYKETITKSYEIDYTHKKQSGGAGQFARIKILICPNKLKNYDFYFENKITCGSIPREYIPSIRKGLESIAKSGGLLGYPVVGIKIVLLDGSYHEVDSNSLSFETAAKSAFKHALKNAMPILLEPIMKVIVYTPGIFFGNVVGHINKIRGRIISSKLENSNQVISCLIPLSSMFGYVNYLRGITKGRGYYSMNFDDYHKVPYNIANKIINISKNISTC
jgi:elongation factor G